MGREYRIQSQLAPAFPFVAGMVGFCDDESVIGSDFYVMERLVGHIPRTELGVELTRDQVRQLCTNTLDLLVDLHAVDPVATGLDSLGMRVLNVNDLGFDHKGGNLFMVYHQQKELLATMSQGGALGTLGLGGIP